MNNELSSHKFPEVYKQLGIEVSDLGCIMLDTQPFKVTELVPNGESDLYTSKDPKKFWIQGAVAEKTAHVTLLYGLMEPGPKWKKQVDEVLKGWSIKGLVIEKVAAFDNHYEDEDFFCIVGHIKMTDNLKRGNARLRFLPHIDTFPEYKPHVTLAYVKGDKKIRDKWVTTLNKTLSGRIIDVKPQINYGGNK